MSVTHADGGITGVGIGFATAAGRPRFWVVLAGTGSVSGCDGFR